VGQSIWQTIAQVIAQVIGKILGSGTEDGASISASIDIPINDVPKEPIANESKIESSMKPETVSLVVTRSRITPEGIFGQLKKQDGSFIAYTLEHSFNEKPKVALGVYKCVRGQHRLHSMTEDFTTFEVTGVPDFQGKPVSGILFHWGNFDKDSSGCFLLGKGETPNMITNSKVAWQEFMDMLAGVDSFELTVE